jgi:4-hydroxybenzoate polyprenyltransferase
VNGQSETGPEPAPRIQRLIAVLWPSFLSAGVATVLFFAVFDPYALADALGVGEVERIEIYSIGFFMFWLLTSASSALTCYFQRPCDRINPRGRIEP